MPLNANQLNTVSQWTNPFPANTPQSQEAWTQHQMQVNGSISQGGASTGYSPPPQAQNSPGSPTDAQILDFYSQHSGDPQMIAQAMQTYGLDPMRVQRLTGFELPGPTNGPPGDTGTLAAPLTNQRHSAFSSPGAPAGSQTSDGVKNQLPQTQGAGQAEQLPDYFSKNVNAQETPVRDSQGRVWTQHRDQSDPDNPNSPYTTRYSVTDGKDWYEGQQAKYYSADGTPMQDGEGGQRGNTVPNPNDRDWADVVAPLAFAVIMGGAGAGLFAGGAGAGAVAGSEAAVGSEAGYGAATAAGVETAVGSEAGFGAATATGSELGAGAAAEAEFSAAEAGAAGGMGASGGAVGPGFTAGFTDGGTAGGALDTAYTTATAGTAFTGAPEIAAGAAGVAGAGGAAGTAGSAASTVGAAGSTLSTIKDFAKVAGPVLGGIASLVNGNKANNTAKGLADQLSKQSDPFAKYRDYYGKKLSDLEHNPGSIINTPGWDAGLQAVERTMNGQGYQGSGNMAAALAKYGESFYGKEAGRLAGLAGAGQTPGAGLVDAAGLISQGQASQQYGINAGLQAALTLLSSLGN